jgi:elongation factor G
MGRKGLQVTRNVALIGHEGSGETTLTEAILYTAGITAKMGRVSEKTTLSDFEPEEKEHGKSLRASVLSFEYQKTAMTLLDTPGSQDFLTDALFAVRGADAAVLCVDARGGIKVNARRMWAEASKLGLPIAVAVTHVDELETDFFRTLKELQSAFGHGVLPLGVPLGDDGRPDAIAALFEPKVEERFASHLEAITERVVEVDDKALEAYLESGVLEPERFKALLKEAFLMRHIFPVFALATPKRAGVKELLDFLVDFCPSQEEAVQRGWLEPLGSTKGFVGYVIKSVADEFLARISYVRVFLGTLGQGMQMVNQRSGKAEKVGAVYRVLGPDLKPVEEAEAGDIVAVTKIEDMRPGDTLTDPKTEFVLPEPEFPKPMVSIAVRARTHGDEQKLVAAMRELEHDDRAFSFHMDVQTGDFVISGVSDLHLQHALKVLKRRRKIELETFPPKIPYKETVTKPAIGVEYTHKKQTGGAGQYGKVVINLEPLERGKGYEFLDKIVGGVIDQSFRPSVDKGVQAKMQEGVIAGYPVVDVRVTLVDGKTHPVDSKDIAFQIAGREAFKRAFLMADPVLLEPIAKLDIAVPETAIGAVIGDLNTRRGRVISSESADGMAIVRVLVPLAEISRYQAELTALTGGEGSFTMGFDHYEVVPASLQKVIASEHANHPQAAAH